MRLPFSFRSVSTGLAVAVAATLLTACGGSDNDGPPPAAVSGTAARGAPLAGATVAMTCANGATVTGTTSAAGTYSTNASTTRLPCIGQATNGTITYRGVLFTGNTANFTPLTDILVEVMLAAATPGGASMTVTQFLAKISTDATFAASVSSTSNVVSYRNTVAALVRERALAVGVPPTLLGAALNASFESAVFAANGADPLDKLLDDLETVLLDANGNLLAAVVTEAKLDGDALPPPASTGTGGTGGSGT